MWCWCVSVRFSMWACNIVVYSNQFNNLSGGKIVAQEVQICPWAFDLERTRSRRKKSVLLLSSLPSVFLVNYIRQF